MDIKTLTPFHERLEALEAKKREAADAAVAAIEAAIAASIEAHKANIAFLRARGDVNNPNERLAAKHLAGLTSRDRHRTARRAVFWSLSVGGLRWLGP